MELMAIVDPLSDWLSPVHRVGDRNAHALLHCSIRHGCSTARPHLLRRPARMKRVGRIREDGRTRGRYLPAFAGFGPRAPVLSEIGLMNLLKSIHLALRQHRAFRTTLAALNSYSDRELGELGLSRSDVARVAYEEAERCMAVHPASDRAPAPAWQQPALLGR